MVVMVCSDDEGVELMVVTIYSISNIDRINACNTIGNGIVIECEL